MALGKCGSGNFLSQTTNPRVTSTLLQLQNTKEQEDVSQHEQSTQNGPEAFHARVLRHPLYSHPDTSNLANGLLDNS